MQHPCTAKQSGFTLIEIAIVLVIIGLIVGGVLVGRDLIHASEIRRLISQKNSLDSAVTTFRTKFNCMPGDCVSASDLGMGVSGGVSSNTYGVNGNGNGTIDWTADTYPEMMNFWYHLEQANLIATNKTIITASNTLACSGYAPCTPFGVNYKGDKGGWVVFYGSDHAITGVNLPGYHYWWLSGNLTAAGDGAAIYSPDDAQAIDSKADDGYPLTGVVLAEGDTNGATFGPTPPTSSAGGATTDSCVSTALTPNTYNIQNTNHTKTNMCSLVIRSGF